MDWQALSQWTSIISVPVTLFVLLYLLPLNRKKLKSEIRKNNVDADKSSVEMLKDDIHRLREEYEIKLKELRDRVAKLEDKNGMLERFNSLFRVAAENLGIWDKIHEEIERIKG